MKRRHETIRFLSAAILLISGFLLPDRVYAQSGSDQVAIHLSFRPVQTIAVTAAQKTIDIEYTTVSDHQNGVSVTQPDHLTIFSTGGFQVSVEASDANFTRVGGSETIPVSDVSVRAVNGTDNHVVAVFSAVTLSSTPAPLIASSQGGRDLKYGIRYDNTASGSGYRYIDKYVSGDGAETVYTTQITYTIVTR